MARYEDLQAELSALSNPSKYSWGPKRYLEVTTELDLYDYALKKGYKESSNLKETGDAIKWLKENNLYDEAAAQAGAVNKAKSLGYTGNDIVEADSFLDNYNSVYGIAQRANLPVQEGMTYAELEQLGQQNQDQFNAASILHTAPAQEPTKLLTGNQSEPQSSTSNKKQPKYAEDEYSKTARALGYANIEDASRALGVSADSLVKSVNPNANFNTQGTLAPNQQQQYNQLVAAGADPNTAMQAALQVPTGSGGVVDTSVPPPGVTPEEWAKLDPNTQAALSSIQTVLQQQLEQNQTVPIALTDKDLDALYQKAQSDPVISQYYGDRLRVGTEAFKSDLAYLQGDLNQNSQETMAAFDAERKALAEQKAAAGQAYSGFRGEAQEKLGELQSGIVESTRRNLQKSLTDATRAFEEKYGSSATNPAIATYTNPFVSAGTTLSGLYTPKSTSVSAVVGTPLGGIAGSEQTSRLGDIEDKYQSLQASKLQQMGANQ